MWGVFTRLREHTLRRSLSARMLQERTKVAEQLKVEGNALFASQSFEAAQVISCRTSAFAFD